jgi:hypothetical protein
MTAELVQVSRDELRARRREILDRMTDVDDIRRRARADLVTPDERDLLLELEEVDFLLGDDG